MQNEESPPRRGVRAHYDDETVTVYQAYRPGIAEYAVRHGTFPGSWSRERMTWVKPSWLWMAYRSGWATKPDQERVLAVSITREGFEKALAGACLSHYDPDVYADREAWSARLRETAVRVQWDPERDLRHAPLAHRSLQLGLTGWATRAYADEWITSIEDRSDLAHETAALVRAGDLAAASALLPVERPYPLGPDLVAATGATVPNR